MKKGLVLTLVASMMMSMLAGCGTVNTNENKKDTKNQESLKGEDKEVKKIGIVQYVEHPSLDTIRENILKTLEEAGYKEGDNIKVEYENAQADPSNLTTIASKFIGDDVDLIVAIATPAAQSMAAATEEIPIIFSAVTDPVGAKILSDKEHPSGNVTGTSDAIPLNQVFDLCKELTPDVEKIGFLYTASETNSQSVIEEAKIIAEDYGFEYEEMTITSGSELQQAAQSLSEKVDAIYTPVDNGIASAMSILATVGREAKIPVYVGADSMVADGGYATVGVNYEDLGKKTAEIVEKVLEGQAISQIPVVTLDHFYKVINATTAEEIGAPAASEGAIILK